MTRQDAKVCAAFECLQLDLAEFQDNVRQANDAVVLFAAAVRNELQMHMDERTVSR